MMRGGWGGGVQKHPFFNPVEYIYKLLSQRRDTVSGPYAKILISFNEDIFKLKISMFYAKLNTQYRRYKLILVNYI